MKKVSVAISILLLIIISAPTLFSQDVLGRISKAGKIRVGLTGDQPPFAMEAIDGSLIGLEIDLANLLADAMNVELELVQNPFKDLLPALQRGEMDVVMSGVAMTTTRNMQYAFIGPYFVTGKSVLSRSPSLSGDNINDLNAKHVKIASLKASTSELYVKSQFPDAKSIRVTSYDEAISMLKKDEINAFVADYTECTYISLKYSTDRFYVVEDLLTTERIGMAVSPNDALLINLLVNFLDGLKESGKLDELEYNWMRSGDWMDRVE